ncbi:putative phosphoserine phosphatase 2 [Methyloligella halotolerans]|uniref:Putative phosphoserine phosphatase 2 n=1 Tax=Methyloligella halotolerans TaxID=1177755 RepID=A0A1E2S1B6_9HYPH|nr:histidine phosphatase family protein [Methyloligella halotolerans]ODA68277.1 putative phosphoserine phosphatase 2 [Methyloligella halotolerans]
MLIDLIRHGATASPGLLLGRTDPPLSPTGWAQFAAQTEARSWPHIVTSPLRRAREAAESLAAARGLSAHIDANWAEMDVGEWDGQPIAALRDDPDTKTRLDAFYADDTAPPPPGGESWEDLRQRVASGLDDLLAAAPQSQDESAAALVVTHGGPIRAALGVTCTLPLAHLWTLRVAYGTRVSLRFGRGDDGRFWGEIVEIVQP